MCKSNKVKFETETLEPIHLSVNAIVLAAATSIQRSRQILKCHDCGYVKTK